MGRAFLVAQLLKNLPAMQETQVQSLGWVNPLEKEIATSSSVHAWIIPCAEERVGYIYSPWGRKESDTTEQLSLSLSVDGWGCVPSLFFDLRPNYGKGDAPWLPGQLYSEPHAFTGHSQESLAQSVVDLRTFATVWELLRYNCSPVCELSAWWLYGGANGDLFQEDLCHTQHLLGLLQPEPLSLRQVTADLCLSKRHSNSKAGLAQSLVGSLGPGVHKCFVWALWASLEGMGFDSKCDFTPPTVLLGLLLCPWM